MFINERTRWMCNKVARTCVCDIATRQKNARKSIRMHWTIDLKSEKIVFVHLQKSVQECNAQLLNSDFYDFDIFFFFWFLLQNTVWTFRTIFSRKKKTRLDKSECLCKIKNWEKEKVLKERTITNQKKRCLCECV